MKESLKGKDVIKNTFLAMYKEKPLEKIKVKELAERSGISRSAFYFYYEDVYDLYKKYQEEMLIFLEKDLSDIVMSTVVKNKEKYVKYLVEDMLRYVDKIDILKIMLNGSEGLDFHKVWFESIKRAYAKAMDFSDSRIDNYNRLMIDFYASGHLQLLVEWLFEPQHTKEIALLYANVSADAMFMGTFR